MKDRLTGIYLILDGEIMRDLHTVLDAALRGGIRLFQYREKRGCDKAVLLSLYERTQAAGALLFVNDAVELAHLVDGIHVGQEDLQHHSLNQLRRQLPNKIIGVSAQNIIQARLAVEADYLGVGPMHATASKSTNRQPLGASGIAAVAQATTLPICAIGGITTEDLASLRTCNIAMAAVIGSIANATDPYEASLALCREWNAHA